MDDANGRGESKLDGTLADDDRVVGILDASADDGVDIDVKIGVLSQSGEPLQVGPLLHKQVHLRGIYVGSRADFEEMNKAIVMHSLQPSVDHVFPFRDVKSALRTMEIGSHFGKLVIRIGS